MSISIHIVMDRSKVIVRDRVVPTCTNLKMDAQSKVLVHIDLSIFERAFPSVLRKTCLCYVWSYPVLMDA